MMRIAVAYVVISSCLLSACLASPLVMGAASMGAFGGQMALTRSLGKSAGDRAERKQAAALTIGSDVDPNAVHISNFGKSIDGYSWTADSPKGRYVCSQRAGYVNVTCVSAGAGKPR